ncbi:glycosyltransferase family 8 protein [Paenibacillus sp. FSL M7-1046]|uniref:glycosyltransferase family 8 protein n=1 Tax=Paenibacillus sp. FSL M7-1046 TaxID=2975315 RepID=UPI0030F50835
MIELALALQDQDGHYAEHAGVVLASVFHNTASRVNVHILHDQTLTEENKSKLMRLTSRYKHTITFYPITLPENMLQVMENVGSINVWTQACMYRLLLPALIPVEKIIYLDCDVLVNMDLEELWRIDLGQYYLGAVWDQGIMEVAHVINSKGLVPERYFNSGVVLFALNTIRCHQEWYEETLHFLRSFPDSTMPDQDALNAVFGGNYLQLDRRFNFFNQSIPNHDFHNKIVHFTGTEKFWDQNSPGAGLHHKYLSLTPWRKFRTYLKRRKRKVTHLKLRYKKSRRLHLKVKRSKTLRLSLTELSIIRRLRSRRANLLKAKRKSRYTRH